MSCKRAQQRRALVIAIESASGRAGKGIVDAKTNEPDALKKWIFQWNRREIVPFMIARISIEKPLDDRSNFVG